MNDFNKVNMKPTLHASSCKSNEPVTTIGEHELKVVESQCQQLMKKTCTCPPQVPFSSHTVGRM
uniref:Uncharacterized protein n=1 Tax=Arundo donax TaxID=35708 RepID=A0A0A9F429_ARUDO